MDALGRDVERELARGHNHDVLTNRLADKEDLGRANVDYYEKLDLNSFTDGFMSFF